MADMTPEQRELARYSLRLPNKRNFGQRKYVVSGEVGAFRENWMSMVSIGVATFHKRNRLNNTEYVFCLTYAGALLALDEGERLDPEDFPEGEK